MICSISHKILSKFMPKKFYEIDPYSLYYKHVTIINYASSSIKKVKVSLNDDARVIIYDCHMFILQAPGHKLKEVNAFVITAPLTLFTTLFFFVTRVGLNARVLVPVPSFTA